MALAHMGDYAYWWHPIVDTYKDTIDLCRAIPGNLAIATNSEQMESLIKYLRYTAQGMYVLYIQCYEFIN